MSDLRGYRINYAVPNGDGKMEMATRAERAYSAADATTQFMFWASQNLPPWAEVYVDSVEPAALRHGGGAPQLGEVVHYRKTEACCVAAVVLRGSDVNVDLEVFGERGDARSKGGICRGDAPGTWHRPADCRREKSE